MRRATKIKGIMLVAVSMGVMSFGGNVQASEGAVSTLDDKGAFVVDTNLDVSYGAGTYKTDAAFQVLNIVNKQREKVGAKPLVMDQSLLETANIRAKDIVKSFSHTRPNGDICFAVYKKGGALGENIAYGYDSASSVMKGWMNSSGHRQNILDKGFKSIGISCYYTNGYCYWVQCFSSADAVPVKSEENLGDASSSNANGDTGSNTVNPSAETNANTVDVNMSDVSVKSGKKTLTISWKKKQGIKNYQIQISAKKSFAKNNTTSIKVNGTKTKYTIKKLKGKKLKSNKKYYVRVRAIGTNAKGETVTGKWKTLNKKTK